METPGKTVHSAAELVIFTTTLQIFNERFLYLTLRFCLDKTISVLLEFFMFSRKYFSILLIAISFFIFSESQVMAKRLALVIGNDDYVNVDPLLKAVNDAKAVAAVIEELGFQVIQRNNAKRAHINDGLTELGRVMKPGDEVLFFFAGHGISVKGQNYLLPTDIPAIKPGQEHSIKKEAFSENEILTLLQEKGAKVSILIIDACRNNPFPKQGTRSIGRAIGLGQHTSPPHNAFVMYSAGLGQQALDRLSEEDENPNSVFTRKLLPLLKTPGLSHVQMAKRLQIEVEQLALTTTDRHKQFPAFYDQVRGNFYLLPDGKETALETHKKPALNQEHILWQTVKGSTKVSDYEFYLRKYPNGSFADVAELKIRTLKQTQAGLSTPKLRSRGNDSPASKCEKLWVARNTIWRNHKYCFSTPRGINYFSNTGCFRNAKQAHRAMSKRNRARVKSLLNQERMLACF